jgi:putative alpha-1,2-mannosidase
MRVREVCENLYRSGPGGICGNEDMGSLSSWYVLSSLGFYPVTPGSRYYAIGSPLFGEARIALGKNKTFTVRAVNNSEINKYIQSASLNGQPVTRTWITQEEITAGGTLIFEMGPLPNKKWGAKPEDAPPSMSNK